MSLARIRHNPEYKYIDLCVRAFQESNTVSRRQLSFSDTRDTPIINDGSMYKLSIVKFQLSTFQIPSLYFQIARNQDNINLGAYTVTLEYDDNFGTPYPNSGATNLLWEPQNPDIPLPSPPSTNTNGTQEFTEYYWTFSWQHFIDIVNTALQTAMSALIASVPALGGIEAPFMSWDSDSEKAVIYARESHFNSDVFPRVNIYFNRPLYALFNTFNFINYDSPRIDGLQHKLLMKRYGGEKSVVLPSFGADYLIKSPQEISTVSNFSPCESIVFSSSTLPVVSNDLSLPIIFIDGQQINLGKTYSNSEKIITDISSIDDAYKPSILYVPSSEYRYISMFNNNTPIKQIDVNVWWRDYLGFLRPLYLPPGGNASIKILFKRLDQGEFERTHD